MRSSITRSAADAPFRRLERIAVSARVAHSPRDSDPFRGPAKASTSPRLTTRRPPRFRADSRPDQTHRRIVSVVRPANRAAALTSRSSDGDDFTVRAYYTIGDTWCRSSRCAIQTLAFHQLAGARRSSSTSSPYLRSFESPTPDTRRRSERLVGCATAIAASVESWNTT